MGLSPFHPDLSHNNFLSSQPHKDGQIRISLGSNGIAVERLFGNWHGWQPANNILRIRRQSVPKTVVALHCCCGRKEEGHADVEKKRVLRNSQIQFCQLQIRDALQSLFGHSFRTSESRSPCPSHSSSSSSVMELFAKELFPLPLFVCLLSLPPFGWHGRRFVDEGMGRTVVVVLELDCWCWWI